MILIPDITEKRYRLISKRTEEIYVVILTFRKKAIRIISARRASKKKGKTTMSKKIIRGEEFDRLFDESSEEILEYIDRGIPVNPYTGEEFHVNPNIKIKSIEEYFENDYEVTGKYDFPLIKKQKIDLHNLELIRFSSTTKKETENLGATVHFFEYDYKFDEVWKTPKKYISIFKQYKQILTPDFSVYTDFPLTLQIFNIWRSRWCGAYFQENGLTVIPTVTWGDERSFDFCFDGIEEGSVIAVSTVGCSNVEKGFMKGFKKALDIIKPKVVINYAKPFSDMKKEAEKRGIKFIEIEYAQNKRVAR